MRAVQTVVVGAGHAGLVMSRLLSDAGREHVVLDRRSTPGGGWQDRWDAFQLVTPNWMVGVPGLEYEGADPDGYMGRDELIAHFRRYAAVIGAPVELDTEVTRLTPLDRGAARFRLATSRGAIDTQNVIVAGGPFQAPHVPAIAGAFDPSIRQVHAHHYRRPDDLAPGKVLLVGSGQTGVQLAEELRDAGREVILAVGRCGRGPRRYRGRDLFWWLREIAVRGHDYGVGLTSVADLPSPAARFTCNVQLSGHDGGHEVNLRRMATHGIRLAGRLIGAEGTTARFATDLADTLRFSDDFFGLRFQPWIDAFIERSGEPATAHELDAVDYEPPEVAELDLAAEGVSTLLWTSGYRMAMDWIELPVLDEFGLPRQERGQTTIDGLSFLGTPWQVDLGSAN
ncbi:MAG TPA: NAD(P)-binding domain-containing protein, partial [Candidatus Limnocylindrales bacterium]